MIDIIDVFRENIDISIYRSSILDIEKVCLACSKIQQAGTRQRPTQYHDTISISQPLKMHRNGNRTVQHDQSQAT